MSKDYGMGGLSRSDRRHFDLWEEIDREGERIDEELREKARRKYLCEKNGFTREEREEYEEQKIYYEDWVQEIERKRKEKEELKKLRKKGKTSFYIKNKKTIEKFKKELNNENFHPNDIKTVDGTLEDRVFQKLLRMDNNVLLKYNYIDFDHNGGSNQIRIVRENCTDIFFNDGVPQMENIYIKKWLKRRVQKATWISIIGIKKYGVVYLYKAEVKGELHDNRYTDTRGIMDYFIPEGSERNCYLRDINNKKEKMKFFADLKVQKKFEKNEYYKKINITSFNSTWRGNYIFDKPESTITEDRKKFKEFEKETGFYYLRDYYNKIGDYPEPIFSLYHKHIEAMEEIMEEIEKEVYHIGEEVYYEF